MSTLFAYGTLLFDDIMMQVNGRTFRSGHALLQGYARYRIKGVCYPGIIPCAGAAVEGRLYFDVDDESFAKLDEFEDRIYEKITVRTQSDSGRMYDAYTYRIKDGSADFLSCEPWDPLEFQREHITLFVKDYAGFDKQ